MFRCGGRGPVLGIFSEGEGVKRGQSTTHKGTALPNNAPPGTSLNLLVGCKRTWVQEVQYKA